MRAQKPMNTKRLVIKALTAANSYGNRQVNGSVSAMHSITDVYPTINH